MLVLDVATVLGAALSLVNTGLIVTLVRHRDSQVARLTAAILHTHGETRAADTIHPPEPPATSTTPPHLRPVQVGLGAR